VSQTNNIHIEGNITMEPELRYTNAGLPVCNIRVAQTDSFMRNGERHETTEYFQVVVWNQQGENVAASLSTGDRVTVSGKLRQRTVEIDGTKRYFTELHADVVAVALRWAIVDDILKSTASGKNQLTSVGASAESDEGPF